MAAISAHAPSVRNFAPDGGPNTFQALTFHAAVDGATLALYDTQESPFHALRRPWRQSKKISRRSKKTFAP